MIQGNDESFRTDAHALCAPTAQVRFPSTRNAKSLFRLAFKSALYRELAAERSEAPIGACATGREKARRCASDQETTELWIGCERLRGANAGVTPLEARAVHTQPAAKRSRARNFFSSWSTHKT